MEIKPGEIALNFAEADWISGGICMPEPLRRKVVRSHRLALVPLLGENFFDEVPELPADCAGSLDKAKKRLRAHFAMEDAALRFANTPQATIHPVKVEVEDSEVDHLFREAASRHAYSRDATMNFTQSQNDMKEGLAEAGAPLLSPEEAAMASNFLFSRYLDTMAVTGGIVAAIKQFREQ